MRKIATVVTCLLVSLALAIPAGATDLPAQRPTPGGPVSDKWWSWDWYEYGSHAPVFDGVWRITGLDPNDPTPNFHYPAGLAADDAGHIYVTDLGADQVMKFDSDGTFINAWGTTGIGDGEFNAPTGVAVDPASGDVLVVDTKNNRVQVFGPGGGYQGQFGMLGNDNGEFNRPVGIAVDDEGRVYVADTFNDRIQKFDASHDYLTQFGGGGGGGGTFQRPAGVAIGSNGDVYVTDNGNRLVQRFNPNGTFVDAWGRDATWRRLNAPTGIAADDFGNIFVSSSYSDRVVRYSEDGAPLGQWGRTGKVRGQMSSPTGLATDGHGTIFVADTMNNRVQRWAPCCGLTIGGLYHGPRGFRAPVEGVVGSTRPDCLEGRTVELRKRGEILQTTLSDEDGAYLFKIRVRKQITLTTHVAEVPADGGDICPEATSPKWWIHTHANWG